MQISIIIPCYKNEDTLIKTLESIKHNILKDFEVIIINDNPNKDINLNYEDYTFPIQILKNEKNEGCAISRNRGAQIAKGEILFFTDADVILMPDTIERLIKDLNEETPASIGCYTKKTPITNTFSVFKNIFHHYNHQSLKNYSKTFWTGCGAIYKKNFLELNGFDTSKKISPIEDIDLGYRLSSKNYKIKINKNAFAVHLKQYSFAKLIRSDLFERAVPWTHIILKNKKLPNSSNTSAKYKISVLMTLLFFILNLNNILNFSYLNTFLALLPLLIISLLNRKFLKLTSHTYGIIFTIKSIVLLLIHFLCCAAGFGIGLLNLKKA